VSWDGEEYVLLQKISVSLERIADALEKRNYCEYGYDVNKNPDDIEECLAWIRHSSPRKRN
jgi:hypothetical protein